MNEFLLDDRADALICCPANFAYRCMYVSQRKFDLILLFSHISWALPQSRSAIGLWMKSGTRKIKARISVGWRAFYVYWSLLRNKYVPTFSSFHFSVVVVVFIILWWETFWARLFLFVRGWVEYWRRADTYIGLLFVCKFASFSVPYNSHFTTTKLL